MLKTTLRFLAVIAVLTLVLGSTSAVYAAPVPAPSGAGCTASYVVRRGDTLTRIAALHGTRVSALAALNGIANPNRIYVGQRLCVSSSAPPTQQGTYYTVRWGDTLSSIAWRFGVSYWDLVVANKIRNPNWIYAGQVLRIPVGGQTQTFDRAKIFLIALEDNGQSGKKIGCGDSVVAVEVTIAPTNAPLRASLDKLLSIKDQYYGQSGLYNALYQSNLRVDEAKILNRQAIVRLAGSPLLGGTCDIPRVIAQLEETVLQFSTVDSALIYINGVILKDALSLK